MAKKLLEQFIENFKVVEPFDEEMKRPLMKNLREKQLHMDDLREMVE